MKLSYYGHSCFSCEINGKHILFDPFISPNELAKNIDISTIKADYIFISHGHEDHIADAISIALRTNALVIANWEIHIWLNKKGVSNTHPMNIGGTKKFDFGKVKLTNAVHSSGLPDGTYGGNPMGFIIESNEGNFYYSGDTALHLDMKLIAEYHKLNFALLPIGDNFTMGIDDAINASTFINCNKIIGVHYDTFPYIAIGKENAIEAFKAKGKELILMNIGETKDIK